LGVEFTTSANRDFYTIVSSSFDGLMGVITVIVFSCTNDYEVFMIFGFCFGFSIMIFMLLFVPESPRYYIAVGKPEKALKVYKYLAKLHGGE
jgi:hypothetical protein